MAQCHMNINRLMGDVQLTVCVKGLREFAWRRTIAFCLFKLAAWILGTGIEFDIQLDK